MPSDNKNDGWWKSFALRWGVLFWVNHAYWLFYGGNWGLRWAHLYSPDSIYPHLFDFPHKLIVPYWKGTTIALRWLVLHGLGLEIPRGQLGTLLIDILGTIPLALIWTVFERQKRSNRVLSEVLYLGVRCWLATGMFLYGSAKIVGNQIPQGIPQPAPLDWIRPLGEISTGQLMWTWLGYSRIFQLFAGANESLGAIFLLFRRTTLLGALLILPAMAFVTMLDLTFQVGPWSGALIFGLGALYLIGREWQRVAGVFVYAKPTSPEAREEVWTSRWLALAVRGCWILAATFGVWSYVLPHFKESVDVAGRQSPLCGAYDVDRFVVDGMVLRKEAEDPARWREVAINWFGDYARIRRMDGTEMLWALDPGDPYRFLVASGHDYHYGDYGKLLAKTSETEGQLRFKALPNYRSPEGGPRVVPGVSKNTAGWTSNYSTGQFFTLNYVRHDPDRLMLQGNVDGRQISVDLHRIDNNRFLFFSSLKEPQ